MAVVNSGDPVSTLKDALDAYTSVQETMIAEAAKLKDPSPTPEPPVDITREGGAGGAVSSRY
jgi:hypothetical protein